MDRCPAVMLEVSCGHSERKIVLIRSRGIFTRLLASRLTTIFPDMPLPEALDTTRSHSVAPLTGDRTAFVTTCPAPPHLAWGRDRVCMTAEDPWGFTAGD